MLGQLARQVHGLVSAPLWYHYDAADLLHLGVIWWAHSIQVSCNLETRGSRTKMILSTTLRLWAVRPVFRSLPQEQRIGQNVVRITWGAYSNVNMDLISDIPYQNLKWGPGICIV